MPTALPAFAEVVARHGLPPLVRERTLTVQVNVGKRCNQACHHCHVEAGPKRTEIMSGGTVERILELLASSPGVQTVDITGGAPELNPSFRTLVQRARRLGLRVLDRCNLTVLVEPGLGTLARFLADHAVSLVCSLPCYTAENVEAQRGAGVFDKSIHALRMLNDLGYGRPGSELTLDLVYNPLGAALPPPQPGLEARYREELGRLFGIEFHHLLTITNMPIKRFADQLRRAGETERYMSLLVNHFNAATVGGLMCRTLVSVGWDGRLYDCDFNQMLELPLGFTGGRTGRADGEASVGGEGTSRQGPTLADIESFDALAGIAVTTAAHCFGCTAGAGSSCGGALDA